MIDAGECDSTQRVAARALSEIERSMCASPEIDQVSDEALRATFEAGIAWMERFIMQSHPRLGRRGAVCPFARTTHESKAMYFCAFDVSEMSFDEFVDVMMGSRLLTLCVFPRNLREESYYKFIDCAHSMLKPFYMNAGLMLGEFHPRSSVHGVHSETIFPMRSDVPIFVIRKIALHDILFIDHESRPPSVRVHELECYLRSVKDLLRHGEALSIKERIDKVKAQLLGVCEQPSR
jgi:hypothetical protein